MKFKKSDEYGTAVARLVFEDKGGDVLTLVHCDGDGELADGLFVHTNGGHAVWLKRRRAIRLALMILDELDPGHTWAP